MAGEFVAGIGLRESRKSTVDGRKWVSTDGGGLSGMIVAVLRVRSFGVLRTPEDDNVLLNLAK